MLYTHVARTNIAISLPGRAKPKAKRFLKVIDGGIEEIRTEEDLNKV